MDLKVNRQELLHLIRRQNQSASAVLSATWQILFDFVCHPCLHSGGTPEFSFGELPLLLLSPWCRGGAFLSLLPVSLPLPGMGNSPSCATWAISAVRLNFEWQDRKMGICLEQILPVDSTLKRLFINYCYPVPCSNLGPIFCPFMS